MDFSSIKVIRCLITGPAGHRRVWKVSCATVVDPETPGARARSFWKCQAWRTRENNFQNPYDNPLLVGGFNPFEKY